MVIDIEAELFAKIYDFDDWDEADDIDDVGKYIIRKVQGIIFPHLPYDKYPAILYNGGKAISFELLSKKEFENMNMLIDKETLINA